MMPDLDAGLYADGTSGHSGSATSEARSIREALSPRRQQVYDVLAGAGERGMTVHEVQIAIGVGHGAASSALTVLHRGGVVSRLTKEVVGQQVYVLTEHVNGREEAPYRPRANPGDLAALQDAVDRLEQQYQEISEAFLAMEGAFEALAGLVDQAMEDIERVIKGK